MAYDEALAARIRDALADRRDIAEKKMFGGLAFLINGKMFCGITGADLMVRVGSEAHQAALARPHVRLMDFTGRPMTGYVYVAKQGTATTRALLSWVTKGLAFTSALTSKSSALARRGGSRKPTKNAPPRRRT